MSARQELIDFILKMTPEQTKKIIAHLEEIEKELNEEASA